MILVSRGVKILKHKGSRKVGTINEVQDILKHVHFHVSLGHSDTA